MYIDGVIKLEALNALLSHFADTETLLMRQKVQLDS